jgi:uncharacterized alpha-E superfamily protein
MARYLERAENTARILNVHQFLLMDLPKKVRVGWEPLILITGSQELFYANYKQADERSVLKFIIADANNPGSILSSLAWARENLRTTRDIVPRESWEQLNDMYLTAKTKIAGGVTAKNRYDVLRCVIQGSQQIVGLIYGTVSRDIAYNFMRMGRYLERGDMTTRILDVRSASLLAADRDSANLTPFDNIQWVSVLKSMTAYQMYRQHMSQARVHGADVLKFILQNHEFPRALRYCLDQVEKCLHGLPRNDTALRGLAQLERNINNADVNGLAQQGLHEFIDSVQLSLGQLHQQIDATYFSNEPG